MNPQERHFLSKLVEDLLKANSAEDYARLSSGSALAEEPSEELKQSLLTLSELSSTLRMSDPIMAKIRHSFNHLQGQDHHLAQALEMAEVNL